MFLEQKENIENAPKLQRLLTFYGEMNPHNLLHAMITREFAGKIALLSSFGADSALLIAYAAEVDKNIPIIFLETGKHFPETLQYVKDLQSQLGLTNIIYAKPREDLLEKIDPSGDLWQIQPNRCCWMRKVEPLQRCLDENAFEAVITGRKRYQTSERQKMLPIELDVDGRFKINPLHEMNKQDILAEMQKRGLPQHPLVAKGYPSIGCEPCTRPVMAGEDERAGRWAHTAEFEGTQKQECGIHIADNSDWSV